MSLQSKHNPSGNALLARDALSMKPTNGIPSWMVHTLDIPFMEHVTGRQSGAYGDDPDGVYIAFQRVAGACMIDQYLADNPLSMSDHGYEAGTARTATTGAGQTVRDGILIDSAEAVAEHLERFVFPRLEEEIADTPDRDPKAEAALVQRERKLQARLGPEILKAPYGGGFGHVPCLRYSDYGYVNYLTAFVTYPELMERDFALQSTLAARRNSQGAHAILTGKLPKVLRLDHDMADSRGTLVDVRTLDSLWFPHFQRAIQPCLDAGIRLIWHCDGNLMEMVPRLLETGIGGFQGFQYEDGMDYEKICRMRARDGSPLMIWAGVSVTRTLPFGTPNDVRKELRWLVENGPPVGLLLGASSSITPGVPWENLYALIAGLRHYRENGR